jgi:hypothetical protein
LRLGHYSQSDARESVLGTKLLGLRPLQGLEGSAETNVSLQRERCLLVIIHDDADGRVDRTVCLVRRAQGPTWCLENDLTHIRHPEQRGSRPIAGRCAINPSRSIIATSPVAGNGRPRQRRGIYQLLLVHGPLVARLREALCHSSRRLSPVFIRLALRRDPCIPVSRLVEANVSRRGSRRRGGCFRVQDERSPLLPAR